MKHKLKALVILSLAINSFAAAGLPEPLNISMTEYSQIQQTVYDKLPAEQQQNLAKQWGLAPQEYSRYLYLMQQTDNGLYYSQAHLDPSWILAINGKDEAERHKFTVLAVKREKARLDKLLMFEKLFQQVQQALYPHQLPIEFPSHIGAKPIKARFNQALNDRLLLFTNITDKSSKQLQQLLNLIQQSNNQVKLDIFLIGESLTNKQIEDWAQQQGIPVKLTQDGIITLNRDAGRYQRLTKSRIPLPLVLINRFGQFYTMDDANNPL